MSFKQGTLWQKIIKATDCALMSGALVPIPTDHDFIEDGGVRFFVRVLAGLRRKAEERKKQENAEASGRNVNPFLPPEKDLFVSDVSDTHVAILNKFNVVEHHLLIITRSFEEQDTLMTMRDFEALWLCMTEFNGIGFYNGGREAGASQRHRHMQMVPLPLAPSGPSVPIEPLLSEAIFRDGIGSIPGFMFRHAFVRMEPEKMRSPLEAAKRAFEIYQAMLRRVGMETPGTEGLTKQSMPYCFLTTRDWMLLIPRSREHFEDISLNSLAYAGSLFMWDERQLQRLKEFGPMNALKSAAVEKSE